MFCLFLSLLMLCGLVGVLVWFACQRVTDHMRANPEAAKLIAEHVIAPLLCGKSNKPERIERLEIPEVKKTKGRLL